MSVVVGGFQRMGGRPVTGLSRVKNLEQPCLAFAIGLLTAVSTIHGGDGVVAVLHRPPDPTARAALALLETRSSEPISVRWSSSTGRVRTIFGRIPLSGSDAPRACLEFARAHSDLFGLAASVSLRVAHEKSDAGRLHLRMRAYIGEMPIADSEVAFHLDVSGGGVELVGLSSELPKLDALADDVLEALVAAPRAIDGSRAIAIAEAHVGGVVVSPSRVATELLVRGGRARVTHVALVHSSGPRGLFRVRVDANTGGVISSGDLIRYGGAPGRFVGKGDVFRVNPVVGLNDGTLRDMDDSAEAVPLEAYTEVSLPDLDGSGVLRGRFVDTSVTPRSVRRVRLEFPLLRDDDGFEEVMIYYHVDSAQRFVQSLGFGNLYNASLPAYANSEPPGVPYEEVQAYFLPDGLGKGVMAFGSGGVDLAEDAEVILHEYGHALQWNQIPDFGFAFESLETYAIAEGWADFFSAAYLMAFSDGFGDACLGEWAGRTEIEGFGPSECVRRLDSEKTYPAGLVGESHADGEMWSASLWEALAATGREDAIRLGIESNYHLPANARFVDAADAVIRADELVFEGAHHDVLEEIFARRGFYSRPVDPTWFYLADDDPRATVPAGESRSFKLEITRGGAVSANADPPLEVLVDLLHPDRIFLDISLRSPAGTTVALSQSTFRLAGDGPVVFGQTVESEESLSAFVGEPTSGVWSLIVTNPTFSDARLPAWGLRFDGFLRGDADRDGEVLLTDVVVLLEHLFGRGPIACAKAGDVDDNGRLDVTDAVRLLLFLFAGGEAPAEPFPDSGEDLTADELRCEA